MTSCWDWTRSNSLSSETRVFEAVEGRRVWNRWSDGSRACFSTPPTPPLFSAIIFLVLQHSRSLFSSDFGRFHHLPVSNEDISVVFYYELNNPSFDEYTSDTPPRYPTKYKGNIYSNNIAWTPLPRRYEGFLKHLEGRRVLMGLSIGSHSRLAYSYTLHVVSD